MMEQSKAQGTRRSTPRHFRFSLPPQTPRILSCSYAVQKLDPFGKEAFAGVSPMVGKKTFGWVVGFSLRIYFTSIEERGLDFFE